MGNLAATPHPGPKPWLDEVQCKILKQQVEEHSDWTLEQHAEALAETTDVVLKKSAIDKYFRKTEHYLAVPPIIETNSRSERRHFWRRVWATARTAS